MAFEEILSLSENPKNPSVTIYLKKYEEKDLYTAILVPEYGSWIRFSFYSEKDFVFDYGLFNRYNETITVQVDKINKIPIIDLLKKTNFIREHRRNNRALLVLILISSPSSTYLVTFLEFLCSLVLFLTTCSSVFFTFS